MKSIAIFILFIGTVLIVQGYYMNLLVAQKTQKTVIKYIPRSLYDEQINSDLNTTESLDSYYKNIFKKNYDVVKNLEKID